MFARLYWLLPLASMIVWLAMLTAMLLLWAFDDHREIYPAEQGSTGQTIPYISDVGAYTWQPLFISMAAVTVVLLDAGMIAERWLRHKGKLAPNTSRVQKALSVLSIIFAVAGAAGIILLSVYDTADFPHKHDAFLGLFIGGYLLSAICICSEYQRLGVHFRGFASLRISFWLKLFFIILEVALAIGFGVCEQRGEYNASAGFEWTLAYVFSLYIATFIFDLWPAVKTKHHQSHPAVAELERQNGTNGYHQGTPGYTSTNY